MRAPHTRWLLGTSLLAASGIAVALALTFRVDTDIASDRPDAQRWRSTIRPVGELVVAPLATASALQAPRDIERSTLTCRPPPRVRIMRPAGTPHDEHLIVRTRRHRHGPATLVELDEDDSFALDGHEELWVDVSGRYAYLDEPLRLSVSTALAEGRPLLVEPQLGARIAGDVRFDRSVWSSNDLQALRVQIEPTEVARRGARPSHQSDRSMMRPRAEPLGSDGAFDVGPLPPDATFEVSLRGGQPLPYEPATVELRAGVTSFVPLTLHAGVRISGTVRCASAPLAQRILAVEYRSEAGHWESEHTIRSDQTGRFELRGLPTGHLRLRLASPHMIVEPVDLGPLDHHDSAAGILVQARLGLRIEGFVFTADGRPLRSAVVTAQEIVELDGQPRALGASSIARTDETGRFLLQGLGADEYELTTQTDAGAAGRFHVREVVAAGRLGIELRMRPGPLPPNPLDGLLCIE